MSLSVYPGEVVEVLLADGWHDVDGETFHLDSYEVADDERIILNGGDYGICAIGFRFRVPGTSEWIVGPFTSILAMRYRES